MSSPKGKSFVHRRGTTAIPNATVHDERLSYTALGLLVTIMGQPERAGGNGYRAYVRKGIGQVAILNAFKELEAAGYRHQFKRRQGGKFVTDTLVSETPMSSDEAIEWHAKKINHASDTTHGKSRTAAQASPRTAHHARQGHASSVPEDQGSLSSYLTKEPEDSKKETDRADCRGCDRSFDASKVTTSGYCRDCLLQQPENPIPDAGAGRAQVIAMLAERRAKRNHPSPSQAASDNQEESCSQSL